MTYHYSPAITNYWAVKPKKVQHSSIFDMTQTVPTSGKRVITIFFSFWLIPSCYYPSRTSMKFIADILTSK